MHWFLIPKCFDGILNKADNNITPMTKENQETKPVSPIPKMSALISPSAIDSTKVRNDDRALAKAWGSSIDTWANDNWIVGYGYGPSSLNQYHELLDILSSCGKIEQQISGGNWLAVQYSSRYAAEKALSSQPIFSTSANVYFGVSRVTPDRLRILQQHQQVKSFLGGETTIAERRQNQQQLYEEITFKSSKPSSGGLDEADILLLEEDDATTESAPSRPTSICDKLLAWYFGWDYSHPHYD
jgi:hypothetical protein